MYAKGLGATPDSTTASWMPFVIGGQFSQGLRLVTTRAVHILNTKFRNQNTSTIAAKRSYGLEWFIHLLDREMFMYEVTKWPSQLRQLAPELKLISIQRYYNGNRKSLSSTTGRRRDIYCYSVYQDELENLVAVSV